jgi:hypothetical protein
VTVGEFWLVPVTGGEVEYVVEHGWGKFEEKLIELNPELMDMTREAIARSGADMPLRYRVVGAVKAPDLLPDSNDLFWMLDGLAVAHGKHVVMSPAVRRHRMPTKRRSGSSSGTTTSTSPSMPRSGRTRPPTSSRPADSTWPCSTPPTGRRRWRRRRSRQNHGGRPRRSGSCGTRPVARTAIPRVSAAARPHHQLIRDLDPGRAENKVFQFPYACVGVSTQA